MQTVFVGFSLRAERFLCDLHVDILGPCLFRLRQMNLQRREITKVFSTIDLLVTPTMMRTAESFAESKNFDPLGTRNTSPFDAFGLPTITVPCGVSAAGLPIGLQITGAPFAESTVLALAHAYERETTWHTRRPKLTSI